MNLNLLIQKLSENNNLNYHIYNNEDYEYLSHAIKLSVDINNKVFCSWGVSKSKDLAFFKGLMELIERVSISNSAGLFYRKNWVCSEISVQKMSEKYLIPIKFLIPDNSNGVGIGLTPKMAKTSAKLELIERHTILTALILNIPPEKCSVEPSKHIAPSGHEIFFYFWKMDKYFTVVALDKLPGGGYIFGHACSTDLKQAKDRAWDELIPNIIHVDKNKNEVHKISNVKVNDVSSFNLYWRFSGDKRIFNFLNSSDRKLNKKIPQLKNIYYSEILVPDQFKAIEFPLKCYRAISPEAQQLFFDNWDYSFINPKLGINGELPSFPHMIA